MFVTLPLVYSIGEMQGVGDINDVNPELLLFVASMKTNA